MVTPEQQKQYITLDFIEGLLVSHGKETMLVVFDRLSKYAHFMTLTHHFTAKVVAKKIADDIVKLHSMPQSIISDRDLIFINKFGKIFLPCLVLNSSSSPLIIYRRTIKLKW